MEAVTWETTISRTGNSDGSTGQPAINMYKQNIKENERELQAHHHLHHTVKVLCEIMTAGLVPGVGPGDGRHAGHRSFDVDPGLDSPVHGHHDGRMTALGYLDSHRGLGSPRALGRFVCSGFAILPGRGEGPWGAAVEAIEVVFVAEAGSGAVAGAPLGFAVREAAVEPVADLDLAVGYLPP